MIKIAWNACTVQGTRLEHAFHSWVTEARSGDESFSNRSGAWQRVILVYSSPLRSEESVLTLIERILTFLVVLLL